MSIASGREHEAERHASPPGPSASHGFRSLSVVVPLFEEEENVRPLLEAIVEAVRPLGLDFELIVVDDGSRDRTRVLLRELLPEVPELVVVALRRNFGQTLALQAGLDRSRGDVVVTMDGDLQNDPADIPRLLAELADGADVVSGWRRERRDTLVLRKIPSWIANRLIRSLTGVEVHDQGCALKAYRGEVVRALDLYGDMHRFVVVLAMALGARISEVEVRHHARRMGRSKYGISRTFKVLADLFMVQMLTWFRESPLRWFALFGTPFLLLGATLGALWLADPRPSVVYPTVALISGTTFIGCLLFGVLSELMIENAGRRARSRVLAHEWKEARAGR